MGLPIELRQRVAVVAAVLALLLVAVVSIVRLTASDDDTVDAYIARSGLKGRSKLRVGVFNDQPLLGFAKVPGSTKLADHDGFDTASYSMTDEREKYVDFAGPYLRSQPEVLMRAEDARTRSSLSFRQFNDLGKRLCAVGSSTSESALRERQINGFDGVAASNDCVRGLLDHTYDAFMLDDVVLAGYRNAG